MKVAFDYSYVSIHVTINQGRMQLKEHYTLIIILMTLDSYHNGIFKITFHSRTKYVLIPYTIYSSITSTTTITLPTTPYT